MTSEFLGEAAVGHVLAALMPTNRLVCELCLETGLRLGDVLRLSCEQLRAGRFSVVEAKTGKCRDVVVSPSLAAAVLDQAGGEGLAFPGLRAGSHRSRQAVYKDLKRAARAFRVPVNFTPHSLRKCYAVRLYREVGDLREVQKLLNHERIEVTLLYALADRLVNGHLP